LRVRCFNCPLQLQLLRDFERIEVINYVKEFKDCRVSSTNHKLVLHVMKTTKSYRLSFSLLADLRTAFDLLDRDQDGMVTPTELQFMLRNLGIDLSDELIDGLMKEASKEGKL